MSEYVGSVYTAVIEGDTQYGSCRDTIDHLQLRQGDGLPVYYRGTKGYQGRQHAFDDFMTSDKAFLLLLDGDMEFQPDAVERLRSHKLPYVSGFYARRDYAPVLPVWYKPFDGNWPFEVWTDPVERGKLHELGASGWGLMLIHRDVITATRKLLHGEWDVLEDDMDIWPYDLRAVMGAIHALRNLADTAPERDNLLPALRHNVNVLEAQLRPNRADKNIVVGSDIRYPFYAKAVGFTLYGDPEAKAAHMCNYPLRLEDYEQQPDTVREAAKVQIGKARMKEALELERDKAALHG